MVRHDNRVRANRKRLHGVVGMKDSFNEKGAAPLFAKLRDIVPVDGGVEQTCDMPGDACKTADPGRANEISDPNRSAARAE